MSRTQGPSVNSPQGRTPTPPFQQSKRLALTQNWGHLPRHLVMEGQALSCCPTLPPTQTR